MEKLPMYEEAFDITYVNTDNDPDFYHFNDEVQDFCINKAQEYPWSYGSY